MASITPLTSLPLNGVTPAGTLALSNAQGRLTGFLTSGGAAQLSLITMTEGGNWGYVEGGVLNVNANDNSGDDVGWLDFTNASTTTKYHCILTSGTGPVSAWLSALTGPGTSTALVAHASSHLAGGSDDLLGAPGHVGSVTPGIFSGTFGPDDSHQNTVPSKNGDTFSLIALAQTFSAIKTFSAAPVFAAGVTASGAVSFDLSGSTATQKSTTGAQTIGGGAAAIGITSSGAAITITAGAASTWSVTSGALNLSGASGVNFKVGATLVADIGATSATDLTLAANKNLSASAGTGAITLGAMTGDTALPTGNLGWAAAATKTLSLAAAGAAAVSSSGGALTLSGAAASTLSTSAGVQNVDGFAGVNLKINGALVADVGATTAANLTLAANKSLAGAAGTGGLSLGSMTGATALPTGALSWAGATAKALTLAATAASSITSTGAALTITAGAASTFSTSVGALTVDSAAALNLGTVAATSVVVGKAGTRVNLGGGTVTQGTSVSTGVTLNASSGVITTFSQSAAAGAVSTFTVTNSCVAAGSVVLVTVGNYAGTYGTNGFPLATVSAVAGGSFDITVVNAAPANALSGALKLNFAVV